MLVQFKLPDYWLKNELQKDAFKCLHHINNLLCDNNQPSLIDRWNFIQDMDNLYYMGNQFFSEEYSQQNFSPFESPYHAFMNYMNILDDFTHRLEKNNALLNESLNNNLTEERTSCKNL